jgi:hypothetical protein
MFKSDVYRTLTNTRMCAGECGVLILTSAGQSVDTAG